MHRHRDVRGLLLALGVCAAMPACTSAGSGTDDGDGGAVPARDGAATAPASCPDTTEAVQQEILVPRCGACHGPDEPAQGLDLSSPGLEARIVGVRGACGRPIVAPGDAAGSYLNAKVSLPTLSCGERMPLGQAPLPSHEIRCLERWVDSLSPSDALDAGEPVDDADAGALDAGPPPACPPGKQPCGAVCIDTIEPTLESLHERVFKRSCVFSSCHGSASPREQLDLTTPAGAHAALVGVASRQRPALALVVPGSPENSFLVHKLRAVALPATDSGGTEPSQRMPLPPSLPLCEEKIRLVEHWIGAGASP